MYMNPVNITKKKFVYQTRTIGETYLSSLKKKPIK